MLRKYKYRHCERSEAIQLKNLSHYIDLNFTGLLRPVNRTRNDGDSFLLKYKLSMQQRPQRREGLGSQ